MVSVSEATDWSVRSSVESKYRALRCSIDQMEVGTNEYNEIEEMIFGSLNGLVNSDIS